VLSRRGLSLFMAVPTIYHKLISYIEGLSEPRQVELHQNLKRLRLMVSGSAALPVSVMDRWKEISGHILLERYGMTEIGMAISNPYHGERKPGHIGQPLPGVEIRLADENMKPVPAGEQGEILVKGDNVFREYWHRPKATSEAFTSDHWFKTGDVAVYNSGSYKIVGRRSVDIIKSGGYKISALEIEEVLRGRADIADCGVVGIPDEEWGELVCAALVLSPGTAVIDSNEINDWIRTKLPAYKVPRKYIFLEDLPRNAMGKVTKKELKNHF
jgi:malonyl-CoA/methylmalonyl-CoA synthetase